MACFRCFRPSTVDDQIKEERPEVVKDPEVVNSDDGSFSAGGDLRTPDIAATVTKKGDKVESDLDGPAGPRKDSLTDFALQQADEFADATDDVPEAVKATAANTTSSTSGGDDHNNEHTLTNGNIFNNQSASARGNAADTSAGATSATGVGSPCCTATGIIASGTSCGCTTSSTCAGGNAGAGVGADGTADPASATTPTTPTPQFSRLSRSPTASHSGCYGGIHAYPWYPPGPALLPRALSRGSGSGSGKSFVVGVDGPAGSTSHRRSPSPGSRSFGAGEGTSTAGGLKRDGNRIVVASRYMRVYGGASIGLPVGRTTTPPTPGVFTSASTRLALHDVLHHRSRGVNGGVGGSARYGNSVNSLANIDFRPRWRY